jgi:hypothetical protein
VASNADVALVTAFPHASNEVHRWEHQRRISDVKAKKHRIDFYNMIQQSGLKSRPQRQIDRFNFTALPAQRSR